MSKELKAIEILKRFMSEPYYSENIPTDTETIEAIKELEEYEQNFKQKEFEYRTKCQNIVSAERVENELKKVNPILGNGEYKVIACGGENKERGKFYALAILPSSDGIAREVGRVLPKSELIESINDNTDIAIYFTNTASIDVVINNLEKVKEYIIGDK